MARAPPPDTQVLPSATPVCVSPLVPPVAIFVSPLAVLTPSPAPPMAVELLLQLLKRLHLLLKHL